MRTASSQIKVKDHELRRSGRIWDHPQSGDTTSGREVPQLLPVSLVWLALVFRLVYIATTPHGMQLENVDAQDYHWLAVNLSTHGVFSAAPAPPYFPNHVWGPLYPFFLATVYLFAGPVPQAAAFVQALVDSVTVAVTFRLGRQVGGYRVGLVTGLLYTVNPASWRYGNELLTEILLGLLLTLSLWFLVRYILHNRNQDAVLFGIMIGLATLCKPNVLFVPLLLALVLIYKRFTHQRVWWRGPIMGATMMIILLLPWMVRNRLVFNQWFYTTTYKYNLSYVSAVATLAHARGETVAPWTPRWWEIYAEIWSQAQQQSGSGGCDASRFLCQGGIELDAVTDVATRIIQTYPSDFITSHLQGWLRSFVPQEHRFWYERLSGQAWSTLPHESNILASALAVTKRGQIGTAVNLVLEKRVLALPLDLAI